MHAKVVSQTQNSETDCMQQMEIKDSQMEAEEETKEPRRVGYNKIDLNDSQN